MHAAVQINGGWIYMSDRNGDYGAPLDLNSKSEG